MKCLSSRSLSGRHLKDVFLPRMPNTDWSCTGRGPPFIEDFCPEMKIHTVNRIVVFVVIVAPVIVKVWRHKSCWFFSSSGHCESESVSINVFQILSIFFPQKLSHFLPYLLSHFLQFTKKSHSFAIQNKY